MQPISYTDFEKIDIRLGTILEARVFAAAKKPAYQLVIDFGASAGIKKSSAQITTLYTPAQLIGMQVVAVLNFAPKQIANFFSECLVLGACNENGEIILLQPQQPASNGLKIG